MRQAVEPKSKPHSGDISEEIHQRAERIAYRLVSTPRINNRDIKAKEITPRD